MCLGDCFGADGGMGERGRMEEEGDGCVYVGCVPYCSDVLEVEKFQAFRHVGSGV